MQVSSTGDLSARRDSGARSRRAGVPQEAGPCDISGDDDTTELEQPPRIDAKLLDLVFLVGLGGVFLANATVAVIEPRQFTTLVADSALGTLIGDATWIAPIITVNDVFIGLAVIATHRFQRLRLPVLAWAGVWLMIVSLLKATTIG
jgi:hypothetical protein